MKSDIDRKRLFRKFSETFIADENLFSNSSSKEYIQTASKTIGEQFLKRIRRLDESLKTNLEERLCFLDVLAIMPPGLSRGFILAPNQQVESAYHKVVDTLINDRMSIGDHPVFISGLPLFVHSSTYKPETAKELNTYLSQLNGVQSIELSYIVDGISLANPTDSAGWSGISLFSKRFRGIINRCEIFVSQSGIFKTSKQSFCTQKENRHSKLECFPIMYGQSKTRDRFGTEDTPILKNIARFIELLCEHRDDLLSSRGQPLKQIFAVPVTNWIKMSDGKPRYLSYGAFFMGLDEDINKLDEQHWIEAIRTMVMESIGSASRNQVDQFYGRTFEKVGFAHQTSAVIDSILNSIARLPDNTRNEMGGLLHARLHLLRAIINSYRSKASRVDTGDFPYPWEGINNPLTVYRDIGIQLGLARALDAPENEPDVRRAGRTGLWPTNQIGQPGFEHYRNMFMPLPEVSASTKKHLLHSNFAVLILLSIKQAFYHTLRTRSLGVESVAISVCVSESVDKIIFECQVWNPKVAEDDIQKEAKDSAELCELAERLSNIPDHPVNYSVEGPYFDIQKDQWVTKTRIHAQNLG